jgi:predicted porin
MITMVESSKDGKNDTNIGGDAPLHKNMQVIVAENYTRIKDRDKSDGASDTTQGTKPTNQHASVFTRAMSAINN